MVLEARIILRVSTLCLSMALHAIDQSARSVAIHARSRNIDMERDTGNSGCSISSNSDQDHSQTPMGGNRSSNVFNRKPLFSVWIQSHDVQSLLALMFAMLQMQDRVQIASIDGITFFQECILA